MTLSGWAIATGSRRCPYIPHGMADLAPFIFPNRSKAREAARLAKPKWPRAKPVRVSVEVSRL